MRNWLKHNVPFAIAAVLVLSLFVPFISTSVYAAKPPDKKVETEFLGYDEKRLDQYTKVKKTKSYFEGDQEYEEYEMTISTLPETLTDLETKVTIEWRGGMSEDGVPYYETGNNVYYAKVTGTRVSIENKGLLAAWDPTLYLGNTELDLLKGPTLVKDPLPDSGYYKNTISWVYGKAGGLFSKSYEITRYVRQIEGLLQDYYVLQTDPGNTFRIVSGYVEEEGFTWTSDIFAYDAKGRGLAIEGNDAQKVVSAKEFARSDIQYPVVVDPTTTVEGNYRDGWMTKTDVSYSTAWNAVSSDYLAQAYYLWVGQGYIDSSTDYYWLDRSAVYFQTDVIPDTAVITYSTLRLYVSTIDYDGTYDSALQIQEGMPTYPSDPLVLSDYNKSLYSGTGLLSGQWFDYASIGYESYTLSSTGISWINKTGWTKFILRSTDEIAGSFPGVLGEDFELAYRQAEYGSSSEPQLVITYTVPIVKPIVETDPTTQETGSTARLWGYLYDDGGTSNDVWFDHGLTTGYGSSTPSDWGFTTGQSWNEYIFGLDFGTLYHYTARAQNSAGISDADDRTFLTLPDIVTSFTATPGNLDNDLAWTKGTGSSRTMIRSSTTGYPSTPTSGTQVYFDAGTSTTDTGLTNGLTYYYSAWGEITDTGHQQYSNARATASGVPFVAGPPTVTTNDATGVDADSAVLNGYLVDMGGEASVTLSFLWDALGDGFLDETSTVVLSEPGAFSKTVSTLAASTAYEFRAKAVGNGTSYGGDKSFTTGDPSAPTMTTQPAQGVIQTEATLWGKVTSDGSAAVTAYFEWGLTEAYGTQTSSAVGLVTDDLFFETLTVLDGLEPSTTYYFRAVGENTAGTGYGVSANFTTDAPSAPTITTLAATDAGASTATLHSQLNTDGGVDTNVRFTWSINATLSVNTTSSGWQTGRRAGDFVSHLATNMTIDATYYFQAEATNAGGSINGTILSFATVFQAPNNFSSTPLTSTSISLVWEPQSDKTLIIAKVGSYPADRLDGEQVYFGSGSSVTYDGLLAGTTYFFRAWSWRVGNNFSTAYAEDAATTTSGARPGAIDTITGQLSLDPPPAPDSWWRPPSGENVQTWPLVPFIDSIADDMGMGRDAMWVMVASIAAVLLGAAAAIFIPITFAAYIAMLGSLVVLSAAGILVGWIVAFAAIVGMALIIILSPQGGSS